MANLSPARPQPLAHDAPARRASVVARYPFASPYRLAAGILIFVFFLAGMAVQLLIFGGSDGSIGMVLGLAVGGPVAYCVERYGRSRWK